MQARKFLFTLAVVLATSASISDQSWARSTTTIVAKENVAVSKEMAEYYAWPEGTLSLVNLPQRTIGWSLNISMQAADQTNFAFAARDTADMQTIIDAFSAIKSK